MATDTVWGATTYSIIEELQLQAASQPVNLAMAVFEIRQGDQAGIASVVDLLAVHGKDEGPESIQMYTSGQ
eukprot:gene13109-3838_t